MSAIAKAWITSDERLDIHTLSMRSLTAYPDYLRIHIHESTYPFIPTLENPLRHVVIINCLTSDDLLKIRDAINNIIGQ